MFYDRNVLFCTLPQNLRYKVQSTVQVQVQVQGHTSLTYDKQNLNFSRKHTFSRFGQLIFEKRLTRQTTDTLKIESNTPCERKFSKTFR